MLAAIAGASGYSGQETLDRVLAHPDDLIALGSDSLAGQPASALDPRLARNGAAHAPAFVPNDEALASSADVVFLCLGHEDAAALEPPAKGVVVDLSGGHRLGDPLAYDSWYGFVHPRPDDLVDWEYALPEASRRPAGSSLRPAATRPQPCSRCCRSSPPLTKRAWSWTRSPASRGPGGL